MSDKATIEQLAWAHDESAKITEILEPFDAISTGLWIEHDDGTIEVLRGTGPNGELPK